MKRLIYIAGRYRGKNSNEIWHNIMAARERAEIIAEHGDMPVVPHLNTMFMDGIQDDQFWLDGTMELMRRCDAVWAMPNWKKSEGAKQEIKEAKKLNLPIFYES
jgi:hypothetical protein